MIACPFCGGVFSLDYCPWDAYRSQIVCPGCRNVLVAYLDLRPLDEQRSKMKNGWHGARLDDFGWAQAIIAAP